MSEKPQPEPTLTERIAEALGEEYVQEVRSRGTWRPMSRKWLDSLPARIEKALQDVGETAYALGRSRVGREEIREAVLAALPALRAPQTPEAET